MLRNTIQARRLVGHYDKDVYFLFQLRNIQMLCYQLLRLENNLFSWLQDIRKSTISHQSFIMVSLGPSGHIQQKCQK